MSGIDATVELVAELDRLSEFQRVAAEAPRSKALYRYLADGMAPQGRLGAGSQEAFAALTQHLLTRLGIWWSPSAYRRLPVMTPWCVRDRACRYDQGPESWGAPREDGFLRDDNSIIKKLPLPVLVAAPAGHPYVGQKPWRGFTACHIWRELPCGGVAGENPWLYSFMPNLVWLPSWIAPLTDRHESHVQELLQRTSLALFRDVAVEPGLAGYAENAWRRLPVPSAGASLPLGDLTYFEPEVPFFRRRVRYLDQFIAGCDSLKRDGYLSGKLICSRYTEGLPLLPLDVVGRFGSVMKAYRDAAHEAIGCWTPIN